MKKLDAAHPMWNRILGILYIPLVFFCYLGGMAGERAIGETNPWIITACHTVGYGLFTVFLTTYPALYFSGRCFQKGKRLAGHLLRWYPVLAVPALLALGEFLWFLGEL